MKTQERPDLESGILKWVDFRHRNTAPALKGNFSHLGRIAIPSVARHRFFMRQMKVMDVCSFPSACRVARQEVVSGKSELCSLPGAAGVRYTGVSCLSRHARKAHLISARLLRFRGHYLHMKQPLSHRSLLGNATLQLRCLHS